MSDLTPFQQLLRRVVSSVRNEDGRDLGVPVLARVAALLPSDAQILYADRRLDRNSDLLNGEAFFVTERLVVHVRLTDVRPPDPWTHPDGDGEVRVQVRPRSDLRSLSIEPAGVVAQGSNSTRAWQELVSDGGEWMVHCHVTATYEGIGSVSLPMDGSWRKAPIVIDALRGDLAART